MKETKSSEMEDLTKRKVGPEFEGTPCPKKVTGSLSFGDTWASSNMTKSHVQFSSINSKVLQNPAAVPVEENPLNRSGGTFGASDGEDQAALPVPNFDLERFNRVMTKRIQAQRSRMKKMKYISDLESKTRNLETKIILVQPQVEAYKYKLQLLQIEQTALKIKIAVCEKQRVLREVEIEKNRSELNKLLEIQKKRQELSQAQERMPDWIAGKQIMSGWN